MIFDCLLIIDLHAQKRGSDGAQSSQGHRQTETKQTNNNNNNCEVAARRRRGAKPVPLCCSPACQQSVDRALQCALSPGGAGWVAVRGQRERGRRGGEERRAGLAGCGLKWQQIVWDTSDPFNTAGSAAACLVRAGRRGRNPGRAPARRQATCGRCCDSYPEEENEGRGETTTLQLGYQ